MQRDNQTPRVIARKEGILLALRKRPMTVLQVKEAVKETTYLNVYYALTELKRDGKCHIKSWSKGPGRATAVYALGEGEDAERDESKKVLKASMKSADRAIRVAVSLWVTKGEQNA